VEREAGTTIGAIDALAMDGRSGPESGTRFCCISLRRHDPDQVRRVFRGSGTLSRFPRLPERWSKHAAGLADAKDTDSPRKGEYSGRRDTSEARRSRAFFGQLDWAGGLAADNWEPP